MAFGTKYRYEFADYYDRAVRIDLQLDGYTGAVTDLNGRGASLEYMGEDGNPLKVVRGSNLTLNVYEDEAGDLDELLSITQQEMKVVVTIDTNAFWSGWVLVGDYQRPYTEAKNVLVSIPCVDGLGLLRGIDYVDSSGSIYTGRSTIIQVLIRALAKTGFTFGFVDKVNIYEENMDVGTAYSPLTQSYVDNELFYDHTTLQPDSCYDVIEKVLTPFSACIFQYRGEWWIHRVPDFYASTYTRTINSSGTITASGTTNPVKSLSANTAAAGDYLRFIGSNAIIKGNVSKSKVIMTEYINRQLILDNSFEMADDVSDYWTVTGSTTITNMFEGGRALQVYNSQTATYNTTWGATAGVSGGRFRVKAREKFFKGAAALPNDIGYITIKLDGTTDYLLNRDGEWVESSPAMITESSDVEIWNSIDIVSDTLPAGTYEVSVIIYGGPGPLYTYWDDIEIYYIANQLAEVISTKTEIESLNMYGENADIELYINDSTRSNTQILWKSCISLASEVAAESWVTRNSSLADTLANHCRNVFYATFVRPARVLQGTLKGQLLYANIISDGTYRYHPTRTTYEMLSCETNGEWIQLNYPGFAEEEIEDITSADSPNNMAVSDNGDGSWDFYYDNTGEVTSRDGIVNISGDFQIGFWYKIICNITDNGSSGTITIDFNWGNQSETSLSGNNTIYLYSQNLNPQIQFNMAGLSEADYTIALSIKKYYAV